MKANVDHLSCFKNSKKTLYHFYFDIKIDILFSIILELKNKFKITENSIQYANIFFVIEWFIALAVYVFLWFVVVFSFFFF